MKLPALSALTIIVSFNIFSSHAQTGWQWGLRGNDGGPIASNHRDDVIDMATDPGGSVYILSSVYSGGDVNGLTIAGYGNVIGTSENIVLSSFSCDGEYRWHKIIGGTSGMNRGMAVKTDTLGGVYVTGNVIAYASHPDPITFPDSLHIDVDSVSGSTNKGLFIVKFDTAGGFEWLRMPQPDTVSYITSMSYTGSLDMDVAPNGDVFVYSVLSPGSYADGAFDIAERHLYIMQYDKDGVFHKTIPLDMTITDGDNPDSGSGFFNPINSNFKRDHNSGRFYLSGSYEGYYGTLSFGGSALVYSGGYSQKLYIASFDSLGNANWARQATAADTGTFGSWSGTSSRVAIDPAGNAYATGYALAGDSWYGYVFENDYDTIRRPVQFLMKLDEDGNTLWITTPDKDMGSNGTAFHVAYANGIAAVSGTHVNMKWGAFELEQSLVPPGENVDVFIGRFNAATGTLLSLDTLTSNYGGEEYVTAITADRNGNFFTGGDYRDQLNVAGSTLPNFYSEDWFVAKLGSPACHCTVPVPDYTYMAASGNTMSFTYTGTTPYTSISWDFGDGSPASTTADPMHTYAEAGTYTVCVTVTNDCGSNIYCTDVHTSGTGIPAIPGYGNINIYPNPAETVLNIDLSNMHPVAIRSIEIYDMIGKRVYRHNMSLSPAMHTIDVSAFVSGIYWIRFNTDNGQYISRFVKK